MANFPPSLFLDHREKGYVEDLERVSLKL